MQLRKLIAGRLEGLRSTTRELGTDRLRLLGSVTAGHVVIHWFQQLFPVALPFVKAGLGLSDVQVGALTTARQFGQGTLNLPAGILADTLHRHRDVILAGSLVLPTPVVAGYLAEIYGLTSAFVLAGAFAFLGGVSLLPLRLRSGDGGVTAG